MRAFPSIDHHGVVARRELIAAGWGRREIQHALATGRLLSKYRGVYAIGRADLTVWGERRAIVLACGAGAVLSARSAAAAWGLRPEHRASWDVNLPSARRPDAPVTVHRRRLAERERTLLRGIPITSPARTLFDLSAVIPAHHLRRAVERAVELDLFHLPDVERVLDVQRAGRGRRALETLLHDFRQHGMTRTRSDLEAAFLHLCLDHDLPRPRVNRRVGDRELDFTWPGSDLIVEIDSWRYHRGRAAFGTDRAKDRAALRAGRRTARFTDVEVATRPGDVAAEVRALLRQGSRD